MFIPTDFYLLEFWREGYNILYMESCFSEIDDYLLSSY